MSSVEACISEQNEPQKQIMTILHDLIMRNDRMSTKIRFRIPFYYQKSWVCYLNPTKSKGVELCFTRANELSNDNGHLDFKDRKQVAGITYHNIEDIEESIIYEVLNEALILDDHVKYSNRKKS